MDSVVCLCKKCTWAVVMSLLQDKLLTVQHVSNALVQKSSVTIAIEFGKFSGWHEQCLGALRIICNDKREREKLKILAQ